MTVFISNIDGDKCLADLVDMFQALLTVQSEKITIGFLAMRKDKKPTGSVLLQFKTKQFALHVIDNYDGKVQASGRKLVVKQSIQPLRRSGGARFGPDVYSWSYFEITPLNLLSTRHQLSEVWYDDE